MEPGDIGRAAGAAAGARALHRGCERAARACSAVVRALPVLAAMSLLPACQGAQLTGIPLGTEADDDGSDTQGTAPTGGTTGDDTFVPLATSTDGDDGDDGDLPTSGSTTDQPTTTATHAASCGDGTLEADELCDDGNLDDGDACLATCEPASCGDGVVHLGVEACDDGNDIDDDACSNTCVAAACGDGVVQPGEACDDGNDVQDDACTDACALPACGDGIRQGEEFCDDAGASESCDIDCSPVDCGDAVANHAAGEDCDDGHASSECDADCSHVQCGDGTVNVAADEACDDGNTANNDACSNTCVKLRRVVFVTSAIYTGNLGGLAGADAKCQTLAAAAGLPGTFYAWLSAGVTSPESRFVRSTVPYVLPSGTQIAKNWSDLTDGVLMHAIDTSEKNSPAPTPSDGCSAGTKPTVWTNTRETAATWNTDGCAGWTATTGVGRLGHAKATNFAWTRFCEGQANSCSWHAALYCVEQ